MKGSWAWAGLPVRGTWLACGQQAPAGDRFELASVDPATPVSDGKPRILSGDAGHVTPASVTQRRLVIRACMPNDHPISGPDRVASEHHGMAARLPDNATREQVRLMSEGLLAERFQLGRQQQRRAAMAFGLSALKEAPVRDETAIAETFDVIAALKKAASGETGPGPRVRPGDPPDSPGGASLFAAVHTGRKLGARQAPVDILVMDHAGKTPVEN